MYAVLHLPRFRLQAALRHEPELWGQPVALVDSGMTTPRVIEVTDVAAAAGVPKGFTAPQALARCATVRIRSSSPAQESAATAALLQAGFSFSPSLEDTAPGMATLDLRGLLELREVNLAAGQRTPEGIGALRRWGVRLVEALASLNLRASLGVGLTPNVARLAACWGTVGDGPVRVVEDPGAFVAGLPVAALEPSGHVADCLARWGVKTVGELQSLGQAELADRLGLEALGLFAAASIGAVRPIKMAQPPETFAESHEFEAGIETLEPMLFLLRRFVDSLALRLEAAGFVAGSLELRMALESGQVIETRLRLPEPSRKPDVLFRMLHTHLETVRAESMVRSVALSAEPARARPRQFSLFEAAVRDPHQFQETLARLAALVGADRIGSPRRENSHRPDAFRLVPPEFDRPAAEAGAEAGTMPEPPEIRRSIPWRRFRPALEALVVTEAVGSTGEARPRVLRCARVGGAIGESAGPWRMSGHWWDDRTWSREEWDVASREGWVVRLVQVGGAWRVEAVLD